MKPNRVRSSNSTNQKSGVFIQFKLHSKSSASFNSPTVWEYRAAENVGLRKAEPLYNITSLCNILVAPSFANNDLFYATVNFETGFAQTLSHSKSRLYFAR